MGSNASLNRNPAGPRIRVLELCARRNCSLRRAAAAMGISPSLLSNYQTGKIGPGLKQILVLSRFFRVHRLDELVEIRGDPSAQAVRADRNRPVFTRIVTISRSVRPLLWDCPDGRAPMEKVVVRVLTRGDFAQVRMVCRKFPEAARHVATTYPDIRRGVRYWVDRLEKERRNR